MPADRDIVVVAASRSLDERARLTDRLATARERGHMLSARQFSAAAEEAQRSADALREVVNGMTAEVAVGAHEA